MWSACSILLPGDPKRLERLFREHLHTNGPRYRNAEKLYALLGDVHVRATEAHPYTGPLIAALPFALAEEIVGCAQERARRDEAFMQTLATADATDDEALVAQLEEDIEEAEVEKGLEEAAEEAAEEAEEAAEAAEETATGTAEETAEEAIRDEMATEAHDEDIAQEKNDAPPSSPGAPAATGALLLPKEVESWCRRVQLTWYKRKKFKESLDRIMRGIPAAPWSVYSSRVPTAHITAALDWINAFTGGTVLAGSCPYVTIGDVRLQLHQLVRTGTIEDMYTAYQSATPSASRLGRDHFVELARALTSRATTKQALSGPYVKYDHALRCVERVLDRFAQILQSVDLAHNVRGELQDLLKAATGRLAGAREARSFHLFHHITANECNGIAMHCVAHVLGVAVEDKCSACDLGAHNTTCEACDNSYTLPFRVQHLAKLLAEHGVMSEEDCNDCEVLMVFVHDRLLAYGCHLARGVHQDRHIRKLKRDVPPGGAVLHFDFAMKILAMILREAQIEWFGKRGINNLVFEITFRRQGAAEDSESEVGYLDVIFPDGALSKCWDVQPCIEAVVRLLRGYGLSVFDFVTDNAGNFSSAVNWVKVAHCNAECWGYESDDGLRVRAWVYPEPEAPANAQLTVSWNLKSMPNKIFGSQG